MASRVKEKQEARERRLAEERAAQARRRRRALVLAGVGVLVALGVLAAVLNVLDQRRHKDDTPTTAAATAGVQTGSAPWSPEYSHLQTRLTALKLPASGTEAYHIHALLHVYVDGKPVSVPGEIGLPPGGQGTSLHTHDTTGVIHMESDKYFPFTLGEFFDVWGVRFGKGTLGGFRDSGEKTVHVLVNGTPVGDPVNYKMKAHDNIVVAYGKDGGFPTKPDTAPLKNL